jgi:hypothetical protein
MRQHAQPISLCGFVIDGVVGVEELDVASESFRSTEVIVDEG